MKKLVLVITMLVFFVAGYLTGSIRTRDAIALELGGLTGLGGTVDSLKSLGRTIIEMDENVHKLQKNIDNVKNVRDNIANYQGVYDKVMGTKDQQAPGQKGGDMQKGIHQYLK